MKERDKSETHRNALPIDSAQQHCVLDLWAGQRRENAIDPPSKPLLIGHMEMIKNSIEDHLAKLRRDYSFELSWSGGEVPRVDIETFMGARHEHTHMKYSGKWNEMTTPSGVATIDTRCLDPEHHLDIPTPRWTPGKFIRCHAVRYAIGTRFKLRNVPQGERAIKTQLVQAKNLI